MLFASAEISISYFLTGNVCFYTQKIAARVKIEFQGGKLIAQMIWVRQCLLNSLISQMP